MNLTIILFLLWSFPGLCQEGTREGPDTVSPDQLANRVKVIGTPVREVSPPQNSLDEDSKDIENLQAERNSQMKRAVELDQTREAIADKVVNFPEELKKLGYDSLNLAAMMDEKVVGLLRETFKNNPMHNMTDEEARKVILEKIKTGSLRSYLLEHPKLLNVFIELVKDKKALPASLGIFIKKETLKIYFSIWVFIMIVVWALKRFHIKKQRWTPGTIFFVCMLINLSATFVSLSIFYKMFHEELSPSANIIVKHWRKR
jgi:hypothetical protein